MPRYVSADGLIFKKKSKTKIFGTGAEVSAQMTDKILEAQRLSGIFQSDKVPPA